MGFILVAARRCHPGAEPGREKIFSWFELERDWLLRLSRNCLKSGGGGRAATTSHLCKEGCLLFTPGSFHSWRKPTFISPASHLYLNYCDIYRPPDEVTTILSRKLVEAKIKKKSKSRSFNFPQQMQENLQSYFHPSSQFPLRWKIFSGFFRRQFLTPEISELTPTLSCSSWRHKHRSRQEKKK